MKFEFSVKIDIDIPSCKLNEIYKCFRKILFLVFQNLIQEVLKGFGDYYMSLPSKPFSCPRCHNRRDFKWKTHHGKLTSLLTIFGKVTFTHLQIQCKSCDRKMYITRYLLGVESRKYIPEDTIKRFGLIGALSPYRVANKIISMFGISIDKMTIWRSVQKLGEQINFDLDSNECNIGEADGTGIPIRGIQKRGKEMKVFVQLKCTGGVRIAGLDIGNYDSQWEGLFSPLINTLKKFSQFLLITDGDTSILKGLGNKIQVKFQRCLWHIPHQFKWYLWKDKVKHKSPIWSQLLGELIDICTTKFIDEDEDCLTEIVRLKEKKLSQVIKKCKKQNLSSCSTYLENAKKDMFTSLESKMNGRTTSHAERVMKTINKRVNVGKWSMKGVLNAMKIRLAYYYNEFDIE